MADESQILQQLAKPKKEPKKRRKQKRKKNPANRPQHTQEESVFHETQEVQQQQNFGTLAKDSHKLNNGPSVESFNSGMLQSQSQDSHILRPPSDSIVVSELPGFPPAHQGYLSPRKEALKRHEHKKEPIPEFLSRAKKNMKPNSSLNGQQSAGPDTAGGTSGTSGALNGGFLFSKQNMEGKSSLIILPLAQIVVYHDSNGSTASTKVTSGALLARGVLEIFQLHNGDVTYMSCGESFVYPLLPKLNILRTNELTFVLPLANPRRYWKIIVHAADPESISKLESVFQNVVQYTNVVSPSLEHESERSWDHQYIANNTTQGNAEKTENPLLSSFFDDVPPSPLSASASPPPETTYVSPIDMNLTIDSVMSHNTQHVANGHNDGLNKKAFAATNPYNTHYASQQDSNLRDKYVVKGLKENNVATKEKHTDEKPETSSMDSLLDEYEENISVTKSMSYYEISSNIPSLPLAALQFPTMHHYTDMRDSSSKYKNENVSVDYDWNNFRRTAGRFPQKKFMNPSHGGRSRKSSTSDLYTSVSNWMEPGQPGYKAPLPHSRSIRSLASRQSLVAPNQLFDAYRESSILASQANILEEKNGEKNHAGIPSHNHSKIHPLLDHNSTMTSKKASHHASVQANSSYQKKATSSSANSRQEFFTNNESLPIKKLPRSDGLTPSEVYDLIRNRDNMIKPKSSGIRGLFGW